MSLNLTSVKHLKGKRTHYNTQEKNRKFVPVRKNAKYLPDELQIKMKTTGL